METKGSIKSNSHSVAMERNSDGAVIKVGRNEVANLTVLVLVKRWRNANESHLQSRLCFSAPPQPF